MCGCSDYGRSNAVCSYFVMRDLRIFSIKLDICSKLMICQEILGVNESKTLYEYSSYKFNNLSFQVVFFFVLYFVVFCQLLP